MADVKREPWEEKPVVESKAGRKAEAFLNSEKVGQLLDDVAAVADDGGAAFRKAFTQGIRQAFPSKLKLYEGPLVEPEAFHEPTPTFMPPTEYVAGTLERRVVSETGGAKGQKSIEFARLPRSISVVAEHFHDGSQKYPDVAPGVSNWSLGYPWSSSINALHRHLDAWERGEDIDAEFGRTHLAAVAFHALVLMEFQEEGLGTDDRYTRVARENYLKEKIKNA